MFLVIDILATHCLKDRKRVHILPILANGVVCCVALGTGGENPTAAIGGQNDFHARHFTGHNQERGCGKPVPRSVEPGHGGGPEAGYQIQSQCGGCGNSTIKYRSTIPTGNFMEHLDYDVNSKGGLYSRR